MSDTRPMAFVTAPGKIEFREGPIPAVGRRDVRIKVKATTLCGSDLHIFRGKHPSVSLPVPVGHEIAGVVDEIGDLVEKVKPGDRVTVEPVIACGECIYCLKGDYHLCLKISFQYRAGQGGLTTDFVAPEQWVHLLPAGLSWAAGALIEPLSVAVHAVRLSGLEMGEDVAIFGAGAIGLFVLQAARARGAGRVFITDIQEARLAAAREFGATSAINSLEVDPVDLIRELTGGPGAACCFEAVGLEVTLRQSLQALKKGGRAVLVGLFEQGEAAIPANLFVQKEISLTGSQGYHWDFQRAIKLVENGAVDLERMISHTFPLDQAQQAFDLLESPGHSAVKVAVMV